MNFQYKYVVIILKKLQINDFRYVCRLEGVTRDLTVTYNNETSLTCSVDMDTVRINVVCMMLILQLGILIISPVNTA